MNGGVRRRATSCLLASHRETPLTRVAIFKEPDDVLPYVEQVVATADANTRELGFLPKAVYPESAERGRLWVAVQSCSGEIAGFLHFGGTYPRLKVKQIFTLEAARRQRVARRLLSELVRYGEEHDMLGITARVASDLPANEFWVRSDFALHHTEAGRSATGRRINVYLRELDGPSLFPREEPTPDDTQSRAAEELTFSNRPRLQAARWVLDLNVVFDAAWQRDEGESWSLLGAVPVVVTAELIRELERTSVGEEDDHVLRSVRGLPRLPEPPSDQLARLTTSLRGTLELTAEATSKRGVTDESDLRHVASCIYHRAYGFVTRDSRILQHAEALQSQYGLRVAAPAELVPPVLTDVESVASPVTVELDHSLLSGHPLAADGHDDLAQFLDRFGLDPDLVDAFLDRGTTQQPVEHRVVRVGGRILGVAALAPPPIVGQPWTAHVYLVENQPESLLAAEHLFEWLLKPRVQNRLYRIDLHCGPGQLTAKQVALDCGFRRVRTREKGPSTPLSKTIFGGFVLSDHWPTFAADFKEHTGLRLATAIPRWSELRRNGVEVARTEGPRDRISLFDFETLISPGLLLPVGRPGVVVPIRPGYAAQLLPPTVKQSSLLPEQEAAFRLERAYFFRAGRHGLLPRTTIVVFYLSGPQSKAAAVARVTFSATLSNEDAVATLGRQGVLSSKDIAARANRHEQVTAFTFDSLSGIPQPIPHHELKRLRCVGPANYVETEAISHDQLLRIAVAGFGEPGS